MTSEHGPIYGVELLDSLPLDGNMRQALPSRKDLDDVRRCKINGNDRVVAGYEVLLEHYTRLRDLLVRLGRANAKCEYPSQADRVHEVIEAQNAILAESRRLAEEANHDTL